MLFVLKACRSLPARCGLSSNVLKSLESTNKTCSEMYTNTFMDNINVLKFALRIVTSRALCTVAKIEGEDNAPGWRWVEYNKLFYGPQRDFVNYPTPKRPNVEPQHRFFIPETFFQGFYEKTGVSGPYVFIGACMTTLFSKEIIVLDSDVNLLMGLLPFHLFLFYKVFVYHGVGKFMQERTQKADDHRFADVDNMAVACKDQLDELEMEKKSFDTDQYFYQAAEDYLSIMKEVKYRETLDSYAKAVKERLDYHFEVESTKVRFEQEQMVDYIKSGVLKNITPQLEKDSLKSCIAALKNLSKTATV